MSHLHLIARKDHLIRDGVNYAEAGWKPPVLHVAPRTRIRNNLITTKGNLHSGEIWEPGLVLG